MTFIANATLREQQALFMYLIIINDDGASIAPLAFLKSVGARHQLTFSPCHNLNVAVPKTHWFTQMQSLPCHCV